MIKTVKEKECEIIKKQDLRISKDWFSNLLWVLSSLSHVCVCVCFFKHFDLLNLYFVILLNFCPNRCFISFNPLVIFVTDKTVDDAFDKRRTRKGRPGFSRFEGQDNNETETRREGSRFYWQHDLGSGDTVSERAFAPKWVQHYIHLRQHVKRGGGGQDI